MEIQKLEADERVRKFLTVPDTQYGTVEYGGMEIKFRMFISKSLRHNMMRIRTQLEDAGDEASIAMSEKSMYTILGQLCVEDPWNKWETWAYIDEKLKNSGGVQNIFLQIMASVAQAADDIKNFRRKR
jgi:hypothetical protein